MTRITRKYVQTTAQTFLHSQYMRGGAATGAANITPSEQICSDRVRAARCAFSYIKLEKRALFSGQMHEFRIYYF